MEREILFRGKHICNGEWYEGSLLVWPNGSCMIKQFGDFPFENKDADVQPETVGQFVGRCDSNGTKVFDGDIVKVILGVGCVRPVVGVIRYRDCGFHFDFEQHGKVLFGEWAHEFYVIGNIHDNPELLNGTES